jgi:hypothetical protein
VRADSAVDPPKLTARWMNAAGQELHKTEVSAKDLAP